MNKNPLQNPQRKRLKSNTRRFGNYWETKASELLKGFGYIVLHRNFRTRFSEIDIICEKDDSLYFVEVKTRTSSAFGEPEEAVTPHKFKKIQLGAQIYLSKFPTAKKLEFLVVALIVEGD